MKKTKWTASPYLVWMVAFIAVPLAIVVYFAFTDKAGHFTLENIMGLGAYTTVFARSIVLAAIATAICLVLAFPVSYLLSRMRPASQRMMQMLIMLPMWMNFLLRTYAWMSLLEHNGIINRFLGLLGVGPFNMINTSGAVVLGITVRGKEEALKQETDYQFCVPKITDFMLPSLSIIPLQLFAYYVASMKGCDIDKPRNLAKSVTVE